MRPGHRGVYLGGLPIRNRSRTERAVGGYFSSAQHSGSTELAVHPVERTGDGGRPGRTPRSCCRRIGVVEVDGDAPRRARRRRRRLEERRRRGPGVPTPMVSPRLSWPAAQGHDPLDDVDHLWDRDVALPRVAEAHRQVGPHPQPAFRARATTGSNIANCSSRLRLRLRWANVSVAQPNTAMSGTPRRGPFQAALVGHQHRVADAAAASMSRQQLLGVGQLGNPLGCTKLVVSTTVCRRRRAARRTRPSPRRGAPSPRSAARRAARPRIS